MVKLDPKERMTAGQPERDRSTWRFYHPLVKDLPVVQIVPASRGGSIPSQLKGSSSCVFSFLFLSLPLLLYFFRLKGRNRRCNRNKHYMSVMNSSSSEFPIYPAQASKLSFLPYNAKS